MLDLQDIKKRWTQSWEAKQDELDRIRKGYLWMYEFERHLKRGEEGEGAYRFPEVMGYVVRQYNEFLKALPEVRVNGTGAGTVGLQAAVDHFTRVSNLTNVKLKTISNATAFGSDALSIMPVTWKRKYRDGTEGIQYAGLGAERVDWRHLFPAPGYKQLHDHTGQEGCPYVFRRRIYHIDSFKIVAKVKGWTNTDRVQTTTWENSNVWGSENWATNHETEEFTSAQDYVHALEYYDVINDIFKIIATGGVEIYDSKEGIPLSHKQIPFHQYKNTPRLDSINGIGEIEINMPYNLFREKILNLSIDDMMLRVQKPLVIDGGLNFNTEEWEVQPGAIFEARGVASDGLQNHIMELPVGGGFDQSVLSLIQLVENSRISVTSDDTTALYSNPNQLATQTLAKMQSMNKKIDGVTKQNVYNTEFYMTNQIVSYIKNELAEPYKDGKSVKYHVIKVQGYDVLQDGDKAGIEFVKGHGASGKFSLNPKVADLFDEDEIEIIPAQKDDELKRDRTEKLMMMIQTLLQTVGALAQSQPQMIQEILGGMNIAELIKVQAKNLGLEQELKEIFPVVAKESYQLDAIDAEHDQIMLGVEPPIREDEDSMDEYEKHLVFKRSKFFEKHASKKAKEAFNKHLINTLKNAQVQKSMPIADKQKRLERTQGAGGEQSIQSPASPLGEQPVPSGTRASLQETKGEMERGVRSRSA